MGRTVLLVDDDSGVRTTIASALEDDGFTVATAANGREALDALLAGSIKPDVILLDLMMPVMDGWTFCAERAKTPAIAEIPVVIFSAHVHALQVARDLRAAGFLGKPPRLRELVDTLKRLSG